MDAVLNLLRGRRGRRSTNTARGAGSLGRRFAVAVVLAAPAVLVAADQAAAQVVCAAPHSAPTVARGGTIRPLPPRSGWFQFNLHRQTTRETFNPNGDLQPLLAHGRLATTSAFLTASVGVVHGVDAWAQAAVHDVRYRDMAGRRERTGFGDPRLAVRVNPEAFGWYGIPVSLRAGVKLPGGEFPVDATVLPLSEGQRDWELGLETGRSFGLSGVYAVGWLGYRWRQANTRAEFTPGDEAFAHLAVGGPLGQWTWELAAEGLISGAPRREGVLLPGAKRKLIQVLPGVSRTIGPGRLSAAGYLPLGGRNLPAASSLSLGYLLTWDRF